MTTPRQTNRKAITAKCRRGNTFYQRRTGIKAMKPSANLAGNVTDKPLPLLKSTKDIPQILQNFRQDFPNSRRNSPLPAATASKWRKTSRCVPITASTPAYSPLQESAHNCQTMTTTSSIKFSSARRRNCPAQARRLMPAGLLTRIRSTMRALHTPSTLAHDAVPAKSPPRKA